jgi:chaperonin GroES
MLLQRKRQRGQSSMENKLIRKTSLGAQYVTSAYSGKNTSQVAALDDNVLIMIDEAVEQTTGGIILTETAQEHHKAAAETGVVVEAGEGAFKFTADRSRAWTGLRPEPGDRVYFQRYAGQIIIGTDGREYRMMTDKCIAGLDLGDAEKKREKAK